MNLTNNIALLTLLLIFCRCEVKTENQKEAGDDQDVNDSSEQVVEATDIVSGYIVLKDAFVATDYEGVKSAASRFKQIVYGNIDEGFERAIISVTAQMIEAHNIEEQRVHFEQVSILMFALAVNGQFQGHRIYKQFCPMAFDNKGAYWLSLEENVINPYFGDRMLNCGYVQEVL